MWRAQHQLSGDGRTDRVSLARDDRPASFADVVQGWRDDLAFRTFFNTLLADCPFAAFRWETPAVNRSSQNQPFECVLIDDPQLERTPNRAAFAEHFSSSDLLVAAFPSLGGDAMLISPSPVVADSAYAHLGNFVRNAPPEQIDAVWTAVGKLVSQRLADDPIWLNTAGAGVPWLHLRIDSRPKYYWHRPYRDWPRLQGVDG